MTNPVKRNPNLANVEGGTSLQRSEKMIVDKDQDPESATSDEETEAGRRRGHIETGTEIVEVIVQEVVTGSETGMALVEGIMRGVEVETGIEVRRVCKRYGEAHMCRKAYWMQITHRHDQITRGDGHDRDRRPEMAQLHLRVPDLHQEDHDRTAIDHPIEIGTKRQTRLRQALKLTNQTPTLCRLTQKRQQMATAVQCRTKTKRSL